MNWKPFIRVQIVFGGSDVARIFLAIKNEREYISLFYDKLPQKLARAAKKCVQKGKTKNPFSVRELEYIVKSLDYNHIQNKESLIKRIEKALKDYGKGR